MNEEQIKNLTNRAQFSIAIREKLAERENSEVQQVISLANTLMGILGLIAGFGFTAFQFIENLELFLFGELLMIGSILYLAFSLKHSLVNSTISTSNLIYDYQDDAAKIKKAILEKEEEAMKKYADEFVGLVNDTEIKPRIIRVKFIDSILNYVFIAAFVGLALILVSFINFCF